jgi:hypothetical protein
MYKLTDILLKFQEEEEEDAADDDDYLHLTGAFFYLETRQTQFSKLSNF